MYILVKFNYKNMKSAIVSTIRVADYVIHSFVNYHLTIGFDYIILFFDDPSETYIEKVASIDKVIIVKNDHELEKKWKQMKSYGYYGKYIDSHVMARQNLNTEVAVGIARDLKVDWLMHLDCDELFYCPDQTLQEHLFKLEKSGVLQYNYSNYEAVPERLDIRDCFQEVTLFKKHVNTLNRRQFKFLNSLCNENPEKEFKFIGYGNGKSIGKVNTHLISEGVHRFVTIPHYSFLYVRYYFKYKFLFKRIPRLAKPVPIILHYPSCGFKAFWRKYKVRGAFPDKWFDTWTIKNYRSFHIDSRDLVSHNDEAEALEFYQAKMLFDDREIVELLSKKIFCRITSPSKLCKSLSKKRFFENTQIKLRFEHHI